MRGWRARAVGAAVLVAGAALAVLPAGTAAAHPLGNFTVNRYDGLVVAPGELRVDHVEDLAEIPAAQARTRIDRDGDQEMSPAELSVWAGERCRDAARGSRLTVDGRGTALTPGTGSARVRPGQAGLPTLRVECRLTAVLPGGRHTIGFLAADDLVPGWREITARGDRMTLADSDVPRSSVSRRLSQYPEEQLSSPPDRKTAGLSVAPGGPALATQDSGTGPAPASVLPRGADRWTQALTGLVDRHELTAGFAALALAAALLLGALHALAPGHGKTLMAAAAAAGGRNSLRDVLALGASVTVTHTLGVFALGALIAAGSAAAPSVVAWLGVASGALVAAAGGVLVRRAWHNRSSGHTHDHAHAFGGGHSHGLAAWRGHAHPHTHGTPAPHAAEPDHARGPGAEHNRRPADDPGHEPGLRHTHVLTPRHEHRLGLGPEHGDGPERGAGEQHKHGSKHRPEAGHEHRVGLEQVHGHEHEHEHHRGAERGPRDDHEDRPERGDGEQHKHGSKHRPEAGHEHRLGRVRGHGHTHGPEAGQEHRLGDERAHKPGHSHGPLPRQGHGPEAGHEEPGHGPEAEQEPGPAAGRGARGHRQPHAHPRRTPRRVRLRGTVLLGFAGGLVPSPSAVVVLVGAAALGRAWFGFLLVIAYGAGLALTLSAAGFAVVRLGARATRRLTERRRRDGRLLAVAHRLAPLGTAFVVLVVGCGLALRGAATALG
ncbi:urease accessory protein UreH domain-containing protein [Streptomyces sp. SYSU K21746]